MGDRAGTLSPRNGLTPRSITRVPDKNTLPPLPRRPEPLVFELGFPRRRFKNQELVFDGGSPEKTFYLTTFVIDSETKSFPVGRSIVEDGRGVLRQRLFRDPQGLLQGRQLFFYEDGTLAKEENYLDGRREGFQREFFPSGFLKRDGFHLKRFVYLGLPCDEVCFDENGVMRKLTRTTVSSDGITNYSEDRDSNGDMTRYAQKTWKPPLNDDVLGDVIEHTVQKRSLQTDEWISLLQLSNGIETKNHYDRNDVLYRVEVFKRIPRRRFRGRLTNKQRIRLQEINPDGSLWLEQMYDTAGKLHGLNCEWYRNNGQQKREEVYIHGNLITRKHWFENGQLELEEIYEDGKLTGIRKEWYPNGQLKETREYLDGELNGLSRRWSEDGKFEFEGAYVFGKEHGRHETILRGCNLVEMYQLGVKHGQEVCWDSTGQFVSSEQYRAGVLVGAFSILSSSNALDEQHVCDLRMAENLEKRDERLRNLLEAEQEEEEQEEEEQEEEEQEDEEEEQEDEEYEEDDEEEQEDEEYEEDDEEEQEDDEEEQQVDE